MYLGETFGVDKKLYPAPGPRRGEAMKWIAWTNVSLGDAVGRSTHNTQDWYPADQQNARRHAPELVLDWLRHMKVDMASFRHLESWSQRCKARPAYQKVMAAMAGAAAK